MKGIISICLFKFTALLSHPPLHKAGEGGGPSTCLLSLEDSMLPGAKGVTLMGLSRKQGTEQASLCPPDMTTQLTLWQGIFFPQGGRKWCLFPFPAGHHPCQAYGPSRSFPVASYLFPHHQTQATHGNGGQVLFHPG